ncbi:Ig-like domain repeat protein [Paenibacillus sp. CC-CFT747]|nr:Ig-like domain repeat protein [Paenibacillus sp. CC-CFT747]
MDNSKPVLTVSAVQQDTSVYPDNTWTRQSVTVTASASDGDSGVKTIEVSQNGGATWTPYTAALPFTETGEFTILLRAVDQVGNRSEVATRTVKIDKTNPVITVSMTKADHSEYSDNTWTNQAIEVTAAASDTNSDVVLTYTLNSDPEKPYTSPIVAGEGTSTIRLTATDEAGNQTSVSRTITIDQTNPTLQPVGLTTADGRPYSPGTWTNQAVTASVTSADSDIVKAEVSYDRTTWSPYRLNDPFVVSQEGQHKLYFRVTDRAGNLYETQGVEIWIHQTSPALTAEVANPSVTNGNVKITFSSTDIGIKEAKWSAGVKTIADFAAEGTAIPLNDYHFDVTENGTYTIYAKDLANNEAVVTVTVSNIVRQSPVITLTPDTTSMTNQDVQVTVAVTVYGENAGNSVKEIRWENGTRQSVITNGGGFAADQNGLYTVYVVDQAGNLSSKDLIIANILKVNPTIQFSYDQAPTNGNVTVSVTASVYGSENGNTVQSIRWADPEGRDYPLDNGQFQAEGNGDYTVKVKDAAGNESAQTIGIGNIYRTKPEIQLSPSPVSPTNGSVSVLVDAKAIGSGNTIATIKWAEGNQEAGYFHQGGTEVSTGGSIPSFEAAANGVYTVYVKDAAGNEELRSIQVENIVKTAPQLTLTYSPTHPTGTKVTIEVAYAIEGSQTGNKLMVIRWAAGDRTAEYFEYGGGTALSLPQTRFDVTANGIYTVYALDAAGNQTVETINITNLRGQDPDGGNENGPGNGNGNGNGNGDNNGNPPGNSGNDLAIILDGTSQGDIASGTVTEDANGKRTVVVFDPQKLNDRLSKEKDGVIITIPVRNGSSSVAAELTAQLVQAMEDKNATLVIQTETAEYRLPVEQIDIGSVLVLLGSNAGLSDSKVLIEVTKVPDADVRLNDPSGEASPE